MPVLTKNGSIAYIPLTLLVISESGTDFSQNGNLEEG
jgi:hypothetical protein